MHFLFFLIACSHSNKDHEGHIKLSIILRGLFHCGRFRGVIWEGAGKTPCFSTSSGSLLAQSEHYWPTSGFARGYRQIIIRNDKRRVRWIEVKLRGSRQMLSPASHSVSRSLSLSFILYNRLLHSPTHLVLKWFVTQTAMDSPRRSLFLSNAYTHPSSLSRSRSISYMQTHTVKVACTVMDTGHKDGQDEKVLHIRVCGLLIQCIECMYVCVFGVHVCACGRFD